MEPTIQGTPSVVRVLKALPVCLFLLTLEEAAVPLAHLPRTAGSSGGSEQGQGLLTFSKDGGKKQGSKYDRD